MQFDQLKRHELLPRSHGRDVAGTHEGAVARDAADRLARQFFCRFVGCRGERRLRTHSRRQQGD
jgi:hypothetical protein